MRTALLVAVLTTYHSTQAQDGLLDASFSSDGMLVNDLSFYDDQASAVIVQPDGRILTVGWTDDGSQVILAAQRLLPNGTPDPTFGTGGTVLSPLAGHQRYGYDGGVQSDGSIIVAGLDYDINLDGNVLLVRYTAAGVLDPGFGVGGVVSTDMGGGAGFQSAWAMRVLDDDRIVIVGELGESGVMCAQFTADGVLDPGFGVDGVALTGISFGSGLAVAVQNDGSILAGGYRIVGKNSDWMVARFRPDGSLDADFGDAGVAIVDVQGGDVEILQSLSVLNDGRIAACGYRGSNGMDYAPVVALLNADGSLDTGFDGDGVLAMPYPAPQWGQAHTIIAQADDKLLVSGFRVEPGETENNDFFLMRLLPDGTLDATFADEGLVHTDLSGAQDRAYGMVLDAQDRIVLAGYGTGDQRAFGYARYTNSIITATPELLHQAELLVFPNPTTGTLMITGLDVSRPANFQLIQADGRCVLDLRMSNASPIELPSSLKDGPYRLVVQQGSTHVVRSVIIAH